MTNPTPPTQEELMRAFFAVAQPLSPTTQPEIEKAMRERLGVPQEEIDQLKRHLNGDSNV